MYSTDILKSTYPDAERDIKPSARINPNDNKCKFEWEVSSPEGILFLRSDEVCSLARRKQTLPNRV